MEEPSKSNNTNNASRQEPPIAAKRHIVFGDYEFVVNEKKLFYKNAPCHLEPKMLDLLAILIEARPNQVDKQELMDKLWPDSTVSDWSLARLVSDTRKLIEDSGKQQSIIRTIRGKGFAFVADTDEIIDAYPQKQPVHTQSTSQHVHKRSKGDSQKRSALNMLAGISILLAAILFWRFSDWGQQAQDNLAEQIAGSPPAAHSDHDSKPHLLLVMQQVKKNLTLTKTTFLAQVRRRNELGELLLKRFPEDAELSWEKRLYKRYPELTQEEKFLFTQIKAMTAGPMAQGNQALVQIMDQHSELFQLSPLFAQLNAHLQIWLAKYDHVFKEREDMALVYVGVEDGVPFPSEIDQFVEDWLKAANGMPETETKPETQEADKSNSQ